MPEPSTLTMPIRPAGETDVAVEADRYGPVGRIRVTVEALAR